MHTVALALVTLCVSPRTPIFDRLEDFLHYKFQNGVTLLRTSGSQDFHPGKVGHDCASLSRFRVVALQFSLHAREACTTYRHVF